MAQPKVGDLWTVRKALTIYDDKMSKSSIAPGDTLLIVRNNTPDTQSVGYVTILVKGTLRDVAICWADMELLSAA
jgi:hypothetical protein